MLISSTLEGDVTAFKKCLDPKDLNKVHKIVRTGQQRKKKLRTCASGG